MTPTDDKRLLVWAIIASHFAPRDPSESLSVWLHRAANHAAFTEIWKPLQAILRLHYRYRFDPHGINAADRTRLQIEAHACLKRIAEA